MDVAMGRNGGRYRCRLLHPRKAAAAGGAAEIAAPRKHAKYKELEGRYRLVPIAVETFGPLNREGLDFLLETGSRLSTTTGDARETFFLFQSLSATIQR